MIPFVLQNWSPGPDLVGKAESGPGMWEPVSLSPKPSFRLGRVPGW